MRTSLEFAGKNEYPISNKEYPISKFKKIAVAPAFFRQYLS